MARIPTRGLGFGRLRNILDPLRDPHNLGPNRFVERRMQPLPGVSEMRGAYSIFDNPYERRDPSTEFGGIAARMRRPGLDRTPARDIRPHFSQDDVRRTLAMLLGMDHLRTNPRRGMASDVEELDFEEVAAEPDFGAINRAVANTLGKREKATAEAAAKYDRLVADQQRELQRVAGLTAEEARETLIKQMEAMPGAMRRTW